MQPTRLELIFIEKLKGLKLESVDSSRAVPSWNCKKVHARGARPFEVTKKINDNAYALNLLEGFRIRPTFNVENW